MRKISLILVCLALSACAGVNIHQLEPTGPNILHTSKYSTPPPEKGPVVVAVYSFGDLTGQRQPTTGAASLSTAVTQGAENYVINALKEYSEGSWFRVVERKGIDNLVKERQIIRSSRGDIEDEKTSPIPPMLYAGVIIEGGIIGYDSNIMSGGQGARVFGIGIMEQYSKHKVTIAMRAVSVASSEVLLSVLVEKELLSKGNNNTTLRFFDLDTQTLELEGGSNLNEAASRAVQYTIEKAIHTIVMDGKVKQLW